MRYLSVVLSTSLLLGCSGAEIPTAPADSQANSKTDIAEAKAAQNPDGETAAEDADIAESGDDTKTESADDVAEEDATEEAIEGAEQKHVELVVKDQATAGQIIVEAVSTSRDGWVSVHKSQADGSIQMSGGIGEARVDSGDSEDIIIDLWEAPAVGDKLWVLLHVDAGDRGLYEFPEKDVPVRKNGDLMARSFKIKSNDQADAED
ncbi:MAG: hypothetical protein WBC73_11815 [Phormidesmis sp.]